MLRNPPLTNWRTFPAILPPHRNVQNRPER
jgi:hypothetical protein